MIRIPALDLPTLDAATHVYTLGDRVIPSVTQILAAVGVSTDFEAIGARSRDLRHAIDLKRQIGTVVHDLGGPSGLFYLQVAVWIVGLAVLAVKWYVIWRIVVHE